MLLDCCWAAWLLLGAHLGTPKHLGAQFHAGIFYYAKHSFCLQKTRPGLGIASPDVTWFQGHVAALRFLLDEKLPSDPDVSGRTLMHEAGMG